MTSSKKIPSNDSSFDKDKRIFDLETLLNIANSLTTTLHVDKLLRMIIDICLGQFLCSTAGIFTSKGMDNPDLILRDHEGFDDFIGLELPDNVKLYNHFVKNARYLDTIKKDSVLNPLIQKVKFFSELQQDRSLSRIVKKLEPLNPQIIGAFLHKDRLNGLLVLGDKLTGERYTNSEKDFLNSLTSFSGVVVENAQLYEIGSQDRMTKVFNHHYFQAVLEEEMAISRQYKRPLSLIMLDIDYFKHLNDTYGHLQGDIVLKAVAQVLSEQIDNIGIVARYGGEEFTIILPNTPIETCHTIAETIRHTIEHHSFPGDDFAIAVTASFGVAEFDPTDPVEKDDFIKKADTALYVSKRTGRNRVTMYSEVDPETDLFIGHYFLLQLGDAIKAHRKSKKPLALILMDVDQFMEIKDTYGSDRSRHVLRELADMIKHTVKGDYIAAHYKDDVFSILLPHATLSTACTMAEEFRKTIQKHSFSLENGTTMRLTCSFGVVSFDPANKQLNRNMFIKQATVALFASKENGRNQVTVFETKGRYSSLMRVGKDKA
jgi:diguanylate cyclase (GGDEF)-like protein